MDKELQSKLVEILGSIQTAAGKAGDFAMSQLPDIAQQYVTYGRIVTVVTSVVCLVVAAVLLAGAWWAFKNPWNTSIWSWEKDAKRSDSNFIVMVGSSAIGVFLIVGAFVSFDWLVWLAPKVWLLKQLALLVK